MFPETIELNNFTGRYYSMMLIFSILSRNESLSGYSLLKKIEKISENRISLSAGAIYPQIDEYVEDELMSRDIKTKISKSSGRTREIAVFSLTVKGQKMLNDLTKSWKSLVKISQDILFEENKYDDT